MWAFYVECLSSHCGPPMDPSHSPSLHYRLQGGEAFCPALCVMFRGDSLQHLCLPQRRNLHVFLMCVNRCFFRIVCLESGRNTICLPRFMPLIHILPILLATHICLLRTQQCSHGWGVLQIQDPRPTELDFAS